MTVAQPKALAKSNKVIIPATPKIKIVQALAEFYSLPKKPVSKTSKASKIGAWLLHSDHGEWDNVHFDSPVLDSFKKKDSGLLGNLEYYYGPGSGYTHDEGYLPGSEEGGGKIKTEKELWD